MLERKRSQDQSEPAQSRGNEVEKSPAVQEEVRLYEARLVSLPALEKTPLPDAQEIIILGGPQDAPKEVEAAFKALGYGNVVLMTEPTYRTAPKKSASV